MNYARYVALGDSFTEGVGDPDPSLPNGVRGWADRFAHGLNQAQGGGLAYANLAIRGRKLRAILAEQVDRAISLEPDLVSIYAGANDIMRPAVDLDSLMGEYDAAIAKLSNSGAQVVMFTAFDPGESKTYAMVRGRFALYCEYVREIVDKYGTTLVDYWRIREFRNPLMWDIDRMHMSAAGHQQMAISVLDRLGVEHELKPLEVQPRPVLTAKEQLAQNAHWAKEYLGPWIKRRVTGVSSGDGLDPRWPALQPVS